MSLDGVTLVQSLFVSLELLLQSICSAWCFLFRSAWQTQPRKLSLYHLPLPEVFLTFSKQLDTYALISLDGKAL